MRSRFQSPRLALRLSAMPALIGAIMIAGSVRAPTYAFEPFFDVDVAEHRCDAEASDVFSDGSTCTTCAALRPRWLARASVVYFDRVTDDSLPLMQNTTNLSQQLNADDFDFRWSTGLDISLTRKRWDNHGFEFRYLDLGQLDAQTIAATNATNLVLNANPPVFAPNVQSVDSRYASDLYSFEANYHHWISDAVTYLIGFRYVGLDDDITADLDAAPQRFLFQSSTRNDLYGAHIGVIGFPYTPLCRCLQTSVTAKIGVFGNDGEHHSLLDTGVATLRVDDSADNTSWVGELGITSALPITKCVHVFGGYGLLWIESIAVASDQLPASDFFNGVGSDDRGGVIFHGAHVGLELQL